MDDHAEPTLKWKVRVLGALEVENSSGKLLEFPGTKSGALLGFLAYNIGQTYTREVLAEMFWPDGDPTNQRTRLRQELSALRTLLNGKSSSNGNLLITTTTMQLDARHVTTDLQQFLSGLERASAAAPGEKERLMEQAVALYRGDLLKDYPDHLVLERSLLSHRYEQILQDLAGLLRQRNDLRGAEERLQQLLRYNPLEENIHIDLMRVYAAAGQPISIRRQYQILEQVLQKEFGVAPSLETQQIYGELLQNCRPVEPIPDSRPVTSPEEAPKAAPILEAPRHPDPESLETEPAHHKPSVSSLRPAVPRWHRRSLLAACAALIAVACGLVWRAFRSIPEATASLPLLRYQEAKTYYYTPRTGQKDNAEAKPIIADEHNNIYAAGMIDTNKEDTDILVARLTPDLREDWVNFYSSPEHDCDRANSLALGKDGGLYVAGETYVPPGHPDREGWHTALVKYDAETGQREWAERVKTLCHNDQLRVKVLACPRGGVLVGCTLTDSKQDHLQLLRYDKKGTCLWSRTIDPGAGLSTSFCDMDIDAAGNVYACGVAQRGQGANGQHDSWLITSYDPNGNQRWQEYVDGPYIAGAYQIRLVAGNVLVGGVFSTGDQAQGGHGVCLALANYTSDGKLIWVRYDPASGPTVDFASSWFDSGTGTYLVAGPRTLANGNLAAVFTKYDLCGNRVFHRQLTPAPGYASSAAKFVAAFDLSRILLVGITSPHNAFETKNGDNEAFVSRLSPDGELHAQYGYKLGFGPNIPNAFLLRPRNRAVIAGQSSNGANGRKFFVVRYDFFPGETPGL